MDFFNEEGQLFEGLIDLIEGWNPPKFSNEKDYQKSLYEYLTNLQDKGEIKEERRILRERGTNRADIVIDDKIAIEVKKDLQHQPEVDRCVAQIKRMKNEYSFVMVVVVGENNSRQHIDMLKHELKEFLQRDNIFGNEKSIEVIQIGKKGKGKIERKNDYEDIIGKNPFEGKNPFGDIGNLI